MQNMSYCRFENTVIALSECLDALEKDGIQKIMKEANSREAPHVMDLIELCREIAELDDGGEFGEDI